MKLEHKQRFLKKIMYELFVKLMVITTLAQLGIKISE